VSWLAGVGIVRSGRGLTPRSMTLIGEFGCSESNWRAGRRRSSVLLGQLGSFGEDIAISSRDRSLWTSGSVLLATHFINALRRRRQNRGAFERPWGGARSRGMWLKPTDVAWGGGFSLLEWRLDAWRRGESLKQRG